MKKILKIGAAALALSLMASASAFAQANPTDAAPAGQGGATSGAPTPDQGGMSPGSTAAAPTPAQGAMTANAAETADTPAGSPPATYPACKHKGEDRCMQEASNSGSHHMRHRMMKSPATPPAPGQ
jgi:hypothetical protein